MSETVEELLKGFLFFLRDGEKRIHHSKGEMKHKTLESRDASWAGEFWSKPCEVEEQSSVPVGIIYGGTKGALRRTMVSRMCGV